MDYLRRSVLSVVTSKAVSRRKRGGGVVRDDNGYQLGLILTQISRVADLLEELVKAIKEK